MALINLEILENDTTMLQKGEVQTPLLGVLRNITCNIYIGDGDEAKSARKAVRSRLLNFKRFSIILTKIILT